MEFCLLLLVIMASSAEMKEFAEAYGFYHITMNPYYPLANGQAECTVLTTKNLLKILTWNY